MRPTLSSTVRRHTLEGGEDGGKIDRPSRVGILMDGREPVVLAIALSPGCYVAREGPGSRVHQGDRVRQRRDVSHVIDHTVKVGGRRRSMSTAPAKPRV